MRDATPLLILESATLMQALERLDQTGERFLICTDGEGRLRGVLTDGDVRKGLLENRSLSDPVREVMNPDPIRMVEGADLQSARRQLSMRILGIPVVDGQTRVVGYHSPRSLPEVSDIRSRKIVVIGLGFVGLTLAVALAREGLRVQGVEKDPSILATLREKKAPFYEQGIEQYIEAFVDERLALAPDLTQAAGDIYIVAVGTPLDADGQTPNLEAVRQVCRNLGQVLVEGNLVILRSTLPVGCCRSVVLPELEKASGLRCGQQFHLAFAPERTAEGRALLELSSNPQIIGGHSPAASERTMRLFSELSSSVVDVGSMEAAELCKLIDNSYRDHVFAYANMLAPLAERLGLDLCHLIDAVNFSYERNRIPNPSPGVGGPCLTKDPLLLASVFEDQGLEPRLIHEVRRVNTRGPFQVRDKLARLLEESGKRIDRARISVVGLAFKGEPETSDLRDSTSVAFLHSLPSLEKVRGYDPIVPPEAIAELGLEAVGLGEAFEGADALVVLNNHHTYANWNLLALLETMNKPAVFLDCWHIFEPSTIKQVHGMRYGGIGND